MGTIAGTLEKAAVTKKAPPRMPRRRSQLLLNPDERSTSVRTVSGGLPTLGKRRQ
jgi:hypothetical protein